MAVMPERQISASTDDVYGWNSVYNPATVQMMVSNNPFWDASGWRWTNVTIPQGSIINSASITIHEYDTSKIMNAALYGSDEDNAATFTSLADLLARPLTTAVCRARAPLPWTNWGDLRYDNPGAPYTEDHLLDVIQEIVNRPGWNSGNALAVILKLGLVGGWTLGRCRTYNFAGNAHGAKLNVTYTPPAVSVTGVIGPIFI